jgi:hypothetical protein
MPFDRAAFTALINEIAELAVMAVYGVPDRNAIAWLQSHLSLLGDSLSVLDLAAFGGHSDALVLIKTAAGMMSERGIPIQAAFQPIIRHGLSYTAISYMLVIRIKQSDDEDSSDG